MAKKAMLLRVHVQTVWVEVDEEAGTVEERMDTGVAVLAADWPGFYEAWTADWARLQAEVAASSVPPLNRAQRRAKKPAVTTNGQGD